MVVWSCDSDGDAIDEFALSIIDCSDGMRGHLVSKFKTILTTQEAPSGLYPVTMAFLDLLSALLSYVQSWNPPPLPPPPPSEEFVTYLSYVRDLFANYDTWRYLHIADRWQMGLKVCTHNSHSNSHHTILT